MSEHWNWQHTHKLFFTYGRQGDVDIRIGSHRGTLFWSIPHVMVWICWNPPAQLPLATWSWCDSARAKCHLGRLSRIRRVLFVGYCHVVCWLNMVKDSVGWWNLQLKWFWHSREHNVFEEQAATEVSCILLHMMPAVQRFQWPKCLQSLMRVRKKNRCQVFKDAFSNPILHALHFLRFQCCTIGPHQWVATVILRVLYAFVRGFSCNRYWVCNGRRLSQLLPVYQCLPSRSCKFLTNSCLPIHPIQQMHLQFQLQHARMAHFWIFGRSKVL